MDIVASTSNTQQTTVLILACLCEHDRTTVVYRTMWETVFRPVPSPLRLFPGVRPYYLEYQMSSSGPRRLNPLTEASINSLTVTSINPLLHGLLLVRDANSPDQWNLLEADGRRAQTFSRNSEHQLTQNLSSITEQQPMQSFNSATQRQLVQNLGGLASQQVPPSSNSTSEQQLVQNFGSTSAQSLAQSSSSTSEQQLVQARTTNQPLDEMFSTPSDRPFAQSSVSPTWDQYLPESSNSTSEQPAAQSTDSNLTTQELIQMLNAIPDQSLAHSNVGTSGQPLVQDATITSEQQVAQSSRSSSEQQLVQGPNSTATQAATAPAADADDDALFTGPSSSPSSTSSHVSNELSCSELLAVLARDDPDVMAKASALGAAREAREARERQEELDREAQPAPAHAPEVEREPRSSTRLMAPNATATERSRSRSAYSSGDNSSGNDATGTNATASIEASASSLATIASYTSNGSPVNMEPWALNTDSPAASLHLVPPPSANRPCPLQPYIDEYLRHRRRVGEVSFDRGLQNLMSPDGRTPEERQRRHEEIEQRQMRLQEEMRSNRVALSHLPSLGAPGPSRRSGNEGDDQRNSDQSYSSKETTTTSESSGAAESEKENVSNDNNRQEDEENRGLGPSGTIRGRKGKGKGKERERSDDDDDEKKKGESSSSPGKRRKSLPKWDGQK